MKTKQILLMILVIGLNCYLASADGLTYNPSHLNVARFGTNTYTYMLTTNGLVYVNPSEFWNGVWKEDANGWRVQLRIFPEANYWYPPKGFGRPVSTNLMLRVEWGSAIKNSGRGYYLPPNGKFAKLELRDTNGNIISPNPDAGTNLLERNFKERGGAKFLYETNLPAWMGLGSGSLAAKFPKIISTDVYPYFEYNNGYGKMRRQITGEIPGTITRTNWPPTGINALKLDEVYSVTNAGDYMLTVQPVLYKRRSRNSKFLDRVDLPCVTTKVHLVPTGLVSDMWATKG